MPCRLTSSGTTHGHCPVFGLIFRQFRVAEGFRPSVTRYTVFYFERVDSSGSIPAGILATNHLDSYGPFSTVSGGIYELKSFLSSSHSCGGIGY